MTTQLTSNDVIIVGGGLAGLTAAVFLARAGIRVTVYEKAATLGGRASTQTQSDYRFNRGIHALYCGGATEHVLNELGIAYTGHSPSGFYVLRDGKLHLSPYDALSMLRTNLLSFGDKLELMRFFSAVPKLNPRDYRTTSIQDWLEQNIRRPDVLQFMKVSAATLVYSSALDLVSADVLIQKIQITTKHPIVYLDGGWQTLVEGLRRAAEDAGAHIVSSERVEAVDYENGRVTGVRLRTGEIVPASAVIIAASPTDALKLVDGGEYPALRQIVDELVPAQLACLDVALSCPPSAQHPVVQDMQRPLFLSAQSLFSQVAPEGGALIYAFKQLDPRQTTDPHDDERELESLLDAAQPGWREVLVKRQYLPRIDALGTLPLVKNGGFDGRPDIHVPGIDGLYLAGDWVGPEGFLADASLASARQIAQLLLTGELAAARAAV